MEIVRRVARVAHLTFALATAFAASHADRVAAAQPSPTAVGAPTPAPSTTPVPIASPAADAKDPCGGSTRLLATLNRPTVGYSACAVPRGAVVLEEGYQNQSQGGTSASVTTTYPQGFERVGIADRFELDLIGPNLNRVRDRSGAVTSGFSDLGLGFKYELPPGGRFTYGVDGLFTAATGSGGFGAGGPTQTLDVDVAYAASPAIGFGTTLAGASSAGFDASGRGARFGYFLPSFVVTAQIPNAYQFYAELVGQTKLAPGGGGHVFSDAGVQKLLGPDLEVDVEYGSSYTPIGGSRFQYIGTGFGLRVR